MQKNKMKFKTVIFDFDGTVADTIEAGVGIYNSIAQQKGYAQITEGNQLTLRTMQPRAAIQKLGIKLYELPAMVLKIRNGLKRRISDLPMYPGIFETIVAIKKSGHKIFLLSSNSKENIIEFLNKNSMNIFDGMHCGSSIFGKAQNLKQLIKENNLRRDEAVYVGDEIRDIEAAKKEQIKIISVTWGLNSKEGLLKNKPDFITDNPANIIEIVK